MQKTKKNLSKLDQNRDHNDQDYKIENKSKGASWSNLYRRYIDIWNNKLNEKQMSSFTNTVAVSIIFMVYGFLYSYVPHASFMIVSVGIFTYIGLLVGSIISGILYDSDSFINSHSGIYVGIIFSIYIFFIFYLFGSITIPSIISYLITSITLITMSALISYMFSKTGERLSDKFDRFMSRI